MTKVSLTDFKKLKIDELKSGLPLEITFNGDTIGVLTKVSAPLHSDESERANLKTQCPNCKMVYTVTPPDGKPPYFTIRHPKNN